MDVTKDDGIRELAKFNQRTLRRQVGHTSACLCIKYYSLSSHPADFDEGEVVTFAAAPKKFPCRDTGESHQKRRCPNVRVGRHPEV